jgi:hypothetical protein
VKGGASGCEGSTDDQASVAAWSVLAEKRAEGGGLACGPESLADQVQVTKGSGKGVRRVASDKGRGEVGEGKPALAKGIGEGGNGGGAEGAVGIGHK